MQNSGEITPISAEQKRKAGDGQAEDAAGEDIDAAISGNTVLLFTITGVPILKLLMVHKSYQHKHEVL